MEYEILNEILTGTVSALFSTSAAVNRLDTSDLFTGSLKNSAHSRASVSMSLGQDSTLRTSAFELDLKRSGAAPYNESPLTTDDRRTSMYEASMNAGRRESGASIDFSSFVQSSNTAAMKNTLASAGAGPMLNVRGQTLVAATVKPNIGRSAPLTVEEWIRGEAPRRLMESLEKLKLDQGRLARKDVDCLTFEELTSEKKRVKNELKQYDSAFETAFQRLPGRLEKEPMRPLYLYYKKLKQSIAKGGHSTKETAVNSSMNSRKENNSSFGVAARTEGDRRGQQMMNNINLLNIGPAPSRTLTAQPVSNVIIKGKGAQTTATASLRTSNAHDETDLFAGDKSKIIVTKEDLAGINLTANEAHRRIAELKMHRSELRERLHRYQVDFTRTNNRKIKYHKDIAPVEKEYQRYKEIKVEITRLEAYLSARGAN
eukprot:TRINITY_DN1716_c0_g1_i1.p1 TRINITY_DN1716_c0_g1~~TRINITY_DN1716_c0_g1_i1.p1  ORF type:complete len:429 (-),score=87.42 TRINITY_DN1716_c0_g1_i1:1013-2299(-)